ncbi:protein of unknown function [Pararobbsia alpina]
MSVEARPLPIRSLGRIVRTAPDTSLSSGEYEGLLHQRRAPVPKAGQRTNLSNPRWRRANCLYHPHPCFQLLNAYAVVSFLRRRGGVMHRVDRICQRIEGTAIQIRRAHDDLVAMRDYAQVMRHCEQEHLATRLAVKFAEQRLCKWLRLQDATHVFPLNRNRSIVGRRRHPLP